ncbi:unnamed protein product [Sympodiomycopsis kandeliae]
MNNVTDKSLPKHPTNKKPYPHSPAGSTSTPEDDIIALTYDTLDVQKATQDVASRWAGATVVFLGSTRDDRIEGTGEEAGHTLRVSRLEYESYTPMALKTLRSIIHRARTTDTNTWPPADLTSEDLAKLDTQIESTMSGIELKHGAVNTGNNSHQRSFSSNKGSIRRSKKGDSSIDSSPPPADSIIRVAIINRLGPVDVGESSILVAVSAPHRRRAFEVAEWLLEETKKKVPIWKREVRVRADQKADKAKEIQEDGSGWIGLSRDQKRGVSSPHDGLGKNVAQADAQVAIPGP